LPRRAKPSPLQLMTSDNSGNVRIWDVTSTRSTQELYLLFQCNTSHHTTFCSFFDSHRCIITDHGLFPIPPQHRPQCAANDIVPFSLETLLRLREDGWIWAVRRGKADRRVCWLPLTYRPVEPTFNKNIIILRDRIRLVTDSGRLVLLDCRKWLELNPDS
jgi:hypothetical protein